MNTIYLVLWEDENSMDGGIHGAYTCPNFARYTAASLDKANETINYEVKSTELSTVEIAPTIVV